MNPKTSKSKLRAVSKYNREKTICVNVRLSINTDADIISHLQTVSSKMGYIKKLIRADMEHQN